MRCWKCDRGGVTGTPPHDQINALTNFRRSSRFNYADTAVSSLDNGYVILHASFPVASCIVTKSLSYPKADATSILKISP